MFLPVFDDRRKRLFRGVFDSSLGPFGGQFEGLGLVVDSAGLALDDGRLGHAGLALFAGSFDARVGPALVGLPLFSLAQAVENGLVLLGQVFLQILDGQVAIPPEVFHRLTATALVGQFVPLDALPHQIFLDPSLFLHFDVAQRFLRSALHALKFEWNLQFCRERLSRLQLTGAQRRVRGTCQSIFAFLRSFGPHSRGSLVDAVVQLLFHLAVVVLGDAVLHFVQEIQLHWVLLEIVIFDQFLVKTTA